VTDAELINHAQYGEVTLVVCGSRADYDPDFDWFSTDSIGLLGDNGQVLWSADSAEALPRLQLTDRYQDVTGIVFLSYYTGGAHCCAGVIAMDPTGDGMKFLSDYAFTTNSAISSRFEGEGDAAPLVANPSGPQYISVWGNTYEPSYAEGTPIIDLYVWDAEKHDFVSHPGTIEEQCAIVSDSGDYQRCLGYLLARDLPTQ